MANWQLYGNVEFNEGRVILTPAPSISEKDSQQITNGAVWSKNKISSASFSLQLTFRSVGAFGFTGAGLSLWLLDQDPGSDISNFGGPSQFSGLQILLDANEQDLGPVFRVYVNDGSRKINLAQDYLGAYTYSFQDSQVPSTLKLGYENRKLKITCDNKLLFETDSINLDPYLKNMRVGISAASLRDVKKAEQFEILMFKFFDKVIESLKVEASETLVAKHHELEQRQARQAQLAEDNKRTRERQSSRSAPVPPRPESAEYDLLAGLDEVKTILTHQTAPQVLQKQLFDVTKSIKMMNEKNSVYNTQMEKSYDTLLKQTEELNAKYEALRQLITRQNQLLELVDERFVTFNSYFQGQSQKHESINDKLKQLQEFYAKGSRPSDYESEFESKLNKFMSAVRLIMMPVLVLLIIMTLLVYKLRNDIKHAKVL
ncbi:hypothetical protein KL930_004065 [Ogataea haglerorum]|uniref:L-type lectin-like domain-containing protein n=1 Tax=Ogataea haglerorum TaxID=1937702 RepID=A0ABQ7RML4_9ASCO|nr:hypothetical protein KL915_004230 [Ogataea haglerorum]KAG7711984.1 hypothetical protein KL914_000626 [Ogataea haglerorum]KAG7722805.1 hypothetical protein KL913_000625 [Ogataea haglerorum]KAG7723094.1 hypothetical protein KL949_000144 [Ogataea haglerorum]KAG7745110.1 hypothetical protein KL932_000140 [Ogataea haglerorum]